MENSKLEEAMSNLLAAVQICDDDITLHCTIAKTAKQLGFLEEQAL